MKKHFWAVLGAVILVYLVMSNYLVIGLASRISGISTVKRVSADYESNTPGYAEVLSVTQKSGILRSCEIESYVAMPGESSLEEKSVRLVLMGVDDNVCYEINTEFSWSNQISERFNQPGLTDNNRRVFAEFSTISIQDGIYRVYYFNNEGNGAHGLIDAYAVVEKKGDSLLLHTFSTEELEPIDAVPDSGIKVNIWSSNNAVKNGYYALYGLALKTGCDSWDSKIYLELTLADGSVHTFSAISSPDSWYNNYYDSDLYTMCKFTVMIPTDLLEGKVASIRALVENDGIYSSPASLNFKFTETGYRRVYTQPITYTLPDTTDISYVRNSVWSDLTQPKSEYYQFSGIAYVSGHPIEEPKIFVQLKYQDGSTEIYPTTVSRNEWMVQQFGDGYAESVYLVQIAAEDVRQEAVDVYILEQDGETLYCTAEPTHYIWQAETGYQRSYTQPITYILPDITDSRFVRHSVWVDLTQPQGDYYQFSGLAYVSGHPMEAPEIYVQLSYQDGSTEIYPTTVTRSEWMVEHFGERYAQSAYSVRVAAKDVHQENVDVYILEREGDTVYRTEEPIHYTWLDGQFVQR